MLLTAGATVLGSYAWGIYQNFTLIETGKLIITY